MDASILIVGDDDFLAVLLSRIHNLAACTVQVAPCPEEAIPLIQAQQPDLLLLQASQSASLELCHHVKEQSRLAWIYCILIDDQVQALPPNSTSCYVGNELEAIALEKGADAYLTIQLDVATHASFTPEYLALQHRLLIAKIQAGLRIVRNHRELMRANDLLSAIALSDPLTELNNRRALEWELPRQIQNSRMRFVPMSLLMLDVDYFKSINDTYGHLVGDRTLKLLSARLRHNLRFYDTPFRYGGEEFVIILSNTDAHEAPLVARRICHLISDQPFTVDEDLDITITVSAGIASLRNDDDAKGISILRRADQNLLRAKSEGRNRVVSCEHTFLNALEPDSATS